MSFQIKQYDNKTALRATLQSEGLPVDLTQVSQIRFLMKAGASIVLDKTVYVVDALTGKVWFPFEERDTAKVGKYQGEFVLTFNDGRRETFPNIGTIPITIISSNIALTMAKGG